MIRKSLVMLIMGTLLFCAAITGTSVPVLILMGSLLLIAFDNISVREGHDEPKNKTEKN